jgi:hypothetical protein
MDGDMVVHVVAMCICVAALASTVLLLKEDRTRQESRFHHFYAHMRDEEFRRTFRLPRPLFDEVVDALRPELDRYKAKPTSVPTSLPVQSPPCSASRK